MSEEPNWEAPKPSAAIEKVARSVFKEGKGRCCCSPENELAELGSGVALYFSTLKVFGLLFLLMTLVALPIFHMGYHGQQLRQEDRDPLYMAVLSIANIGFSPEASLTSNTTTVADDPVFSLPLLGGFTEKQMSMIVTYSVLINAVIFLSFVMWYPSFVKDQERVVDESHIVASDYSVYVRGLPSDATEEEVLEHFDKLYNLWGGDWTLKTCCFYKRSSRPRFRPDTAVNRSRWANMNATAKHHRSGFKRITADPVTNVDHLIDPFVKPEDADPSGWRREQMEAFRESGGKEEKDERAEMGKSTRALAAAKARVASKDPTERLEADFPDDGLGARASMFHGRWVADVTLVHPNGALLQRYLTVRKLLQKLDKETSRARMLRKLEKERALKAQVEKLDRLERKLRETNKKSLTAWDDKTVVSAFVLFENEESRKRCLYDYTTYTSRWAGQAKPLLFRGKHVLEVLPAPEPEELAWENMEVTDCSRCWRQAATACVALLLLIASLGVIIAANGAKTTFSQNVPATSVCALELPALHYGGYDNVPESFSLVRDEANCTAKAAERTAWIQAGLSQPGDGHSGSSPVLVGIRYEPAPDVQSIPQSFIDAAGDPRCVTGRCFGISDSYRCNTIESEGSRLNTFVASSVASCYCIQQFVAALEQYGASGLTKVQEQEGELCVDLLTAYASAQSLVIGAALLVVVVNAVLKTVLTVITKFEAHAIHSDGTASLAFKIFLAQFINTGLIVLLVNAQFEFVSQIGLKDGLLGLFSGGFESFVPRWYSAVGVGICITMLSNVVVPHIGTIVQVVLIPIKRNCTQPVDDEEMEGVYALPAFDASSNYPVILNVVFVTMLYSSGLPILLPIASVFMWVTYWLDRYCLYRCKARPAYEGPVVAKQIGRLLPVSVLLHLCLAVWMLGDANTLKSEPFTLGAYARGTRDADSAITSTAQEASAWDLVGLVPRILRANTFPIFVLLVFVVALRIVYFIVGRPLVTLLRTVVWTITCGFCCRGHTPDHEVDELNPAFTKAFAQSIGEENMAQLQTLEKDPSAVVLPDHFRGAQFMMQGHVFTEEEERLDWRHLKGMRKRTWQVIQTHHAPLYHVSLNHKYRDAYFAIKEGMDFQAAAEKDVEEEYQAQEQQDAELSHAASQLEEQSSRAQVFAGDSIIDDSRAGAQDRGHSTAVVTVSSAGASAGAYAPPPRGTSRPNGDDGGDDDIGDEKGMEDAAAEASSP